MCYLFKDFNGSIWHALWVLSPVGIGVFLFEFFSLKKGSCYYFDPKHNVDPRLANAGDFEPHSKRYQDLAKFAITLSAGAIAFLISTLARDKPSPSALDQKFTAVAPIVVGYFGACIALLMAFMIAQTVCYEAYCHSPAHTSYTRSQYALNMSLGWTGLISFVLGFVWLATNVLG